jgi:hypothetical protein
MFSAVESSEATFPWTSRPAALARFGRAAEVALGADQGRPVSIEAFELGIRRADRRVGTVLGLVLSAPIWIPLLAFAALVLAIPSMVYIPFRIWREWDDAQRVGVSPAMMIVTIAVLWFFSGIGGLILALILVGKVWPIGSAVVLARSGDDVWLLHQQWPLFTFPQFRAIERFERHDLSLVGSAGEKRVVLSLHRTDGPVEVVVKRGPRLIAGPPEVNEANLRLLVSH